MESTASETFTFLFTDIEGSTRLWQDDRDAMSAALAVHDETLIRIVQESGGNVFKHTLADTLVWMWRGYGPE